MLDIGQDEELQTKSDDDSIFAGFSIFNFYGHSLPGKITVANQGFKMGICRIHAHNVEKDLTRAGDVRPTEPQFPQKR